MKFTSRKEFKLTKAKAEKYLGIKLTNQEYKNFNKVLVPAIYELENVGRLMNFIQKQYAKIETIEKRIEKRKSPIKSPIKK